MKISSTQSAVTLAVIVLSLTRLGSEYSYAQDARLHVYADSVSVGDHFHVTISVERAANAEAIFPSPERGDSVLGDLEILAVERGRPALETIGTMERDSLRYLVTTFALDAALVPPLVVFVVVDGDTTASMTEPASIPVRSLVPEDAEDVLDLTPIVPFRRALWPWLVAGLAAALAGLAALLLYRRRRRRMHAVPVAPAEPDLSPFHEAMERLVTLEGVDLERAVEVKPFYVELADILRTYLERSTGIPALESTTRDLMRTLERRQMRGFPSTAVALVRKVLETADLAKFADARPPASTGYAAVGETRQIIEEVEDNLRPAPELIERDA